MEPGKAGRRGGVAAKKHLVYGREYHATRRRFMRRMLDRAFRDYREARGAMSDKDVRIDTGFDFAGRWFVYVVEYETVDECDCSAEPWAVYGHGLTMKPDGTLLCSRTGKRPNTAAHGKMMAEMAEFFSSRRRD